MIALIVTTLSVYAIAQMTISLAMPVGLLVLVVTMGGFGLAPFVGNSLEKSHPKFPLGPPIPITPGFPTARSQTLQPIPHKDRLEPYYSRLPWR